MEWNAGLPYAGGTMVRSTVVMMMYDFWSRSMLVLTQNRNNIIFEIERHKFQKFFFVRVHT